MSTARRISITVIVVSRLFGRRRGHCRGFDGRRTTVINRCRQPGNGGRVVIVATTSAAAAAATATAAGGRRHFGR